jgi:very-short-patch-repair endonuclease
MNHHRRIDIELRRWLRDHYGIIGYIEALNLGATPDMIEWRVVRGEWDRICRGVFRDAARPPGPYQDLRAAWVAIGGQGAVSHASAAFLWALLPSPPENPELTVPIGGRRGFGFANLTIHRSRDLDLSTAVRRNTILVTNPLRTLVDLAGCVPPDQLTSAVDTALAGRMLTIAGLEAEIRRRARSGRPGVRLLRRHLASRGFIGAPPASVLEAHLRRLILGTGLAVPAVELRVGPDGEYRLDVAWQEILLAIEVDGYVWHFSPEHHARDVTRRNRLQQAGWTMLIYTWRQVVSEPHRVAAEITTTYRRLSAAAAGTGTGTR